jgi:crossover junction endodeoxyribonuclease RuvC
LRVLGIDPGTLSVGYAVLEARGNAIRPVLYGAVRAAPRLPIEARLVRIFDGLSEVIRKGRPDCAAVESLFADRRIHSGIRIGEGRGVALLAAGRAGLPIAEYAPATVKKAIAGSGRAGKEQIQRMIQLLLGLPAPPQPNDAADALAIALCHIHRHGSAGRLPARPR